MLASSLIIIIPEIIFVQMNLEQDSKHLA